MKHGEQLAPLIEAVLADAGHRAAGPHRDRGRRRPGTVHRAAGRAGHRPHAGLRARDPGVRRVLARRARRRGRARRRRGRARLRGRHRRAPQGGLPRVLRRRRGAASTGPTCSGRPTPPPTCRSSARARVLYPEAFPRSPSGRSCPSAGLAGPRRRRGAGRAARPRAALPAPPRRDRPRAPRRRCRDRGQVEVRLAGPDDADAVAALERDALGVRRVVAGPRRRRGRGAGADHALPRGRASVDRTSSVETIVGLRRGQHRRRPRRAAADRGGGDPPSYRASPPACSPGSSTRP